MAILGFLIGGIISVVLAIYQFINLAFAICGYFMAFELLKASDTLLATYGKFIPIQSESASLVLGMLFCVVTIFFLAGLSHVALISLAVIAIILSLIGLLFGTEPAAFLVGALAVLLMPFLLKRLTIPLILWKDDCENLLECLGNTLLLAIISAPAFITAVVEVLVFVDGGRVQAHEFTTYIVVPILYVSLFFAQLKRNKII